MLSRINIKNTVVFLLFALMAISGHAQVIFEAKANNKKIPLNGSVQVTYTIKNGKKLKGFTPPNFSPFKSRGPSTSTSTQIINGNYSQSQSYTYTLFPTKKGKFTLASATIVNSGQRIKSNKTYVEVVDKLTQADKKKNTSQGGYSDEELGKNLFIRVIPSKSKVYKGEQITLTYKLYTRVNFGQIAYTKTPQFNGFLHHELEVGKKESQPINENYKEQQFQTRLFKKVAVFPTKSGKLKIPNIEFETEVHVQNQRSRSLFSRTKRIPFKFKTNSVHLDVAELPSPSPQGFTGGVGKFNYSVSYDKNTTAANDPITLKIKITGQGNIALLNLKDLNFPASFEVFDPKVKEYINKKSSTLNGSKSYEYLIIPRGGGDFKIDDIVLSHFDPNEGKYVSKTFPGPTIKVEGAALGTNSEIVINTGKKTNLDVLNQDIRHIHSGEIKTTEKSSIINSLWFWFLTALPIVLLFLLPRVLHGFRLKKQSKKAKGALAGKEAIQALKNLQKENQVSISSVQQVLWDYIAVKTRIPIANLNKDKAKEALIAKNCSEASADKIVSLIDKCEELSYAASSEEVWSGIVEQAIDNINELEK